MGLTLQADGYKKESFRIGYIGFTFLREVIAKSHDKEFGDLYKKWCESALIPSRELTEKEIDRWNEICDPDLDILLLHSDCDGKIKYHDCRRVIRALDRIGLEYPDESRQDYKEKYFILKDMIRYCAKNKKRLYFY